MRDVPLKFAIPVLAVCALPLAFAVYHYSATSPVLVKIAASEQPCTIATRDYLTVHNPLVNKIAACLKVLNALPGDQVVGSNPAAAYCARMLPVEIPKDTLLKRAMEEICQRYPLIATEHN
jgi:hypothetical protein